MLQSPTTLSKKTLNCPIEYPEAKEFWVQNPQNYIRLTVSQLCAHEFCFDSHIQHPLVDSTLVFLQWTYNHFKLKTSALRQGKQVFTRTSKNGPILTETNHLEVGLLFYRNFPIKKHFDFGIPMIFNFNWSISTLKTPSN